MKFYLTAIGSGNSLNYPHQKKYDGGPTRAIQEFLNNNQDRFIIDESYCDYYGHNVTWNSNGYLKKIST